MNKKISFAGPWITQKEIDYVMDAVKNGWYETFFMHIKKLEQAVAEYLGMKYALATHCCTLALDLSSASLGLQEGDEVLCPDFSWVATAYSVKYTEAKLVFVDIDPDFWCIDPKAMEKAITKRTKAIMLVHTFGHPAEMDTVMEIARGHDLRVIEDAARPWEPNSRDGKWAPSGTSAASVFTGPKSPLPGRGESWSPTTRSCTIGPASWPPWGGPTPRRFSGRIPWDISIPSPI
jgi:perosamine synthetase